MVGISPCTPRRSRREVNHVAAATLRERAQCPLGEHEEAKEANQVGLRDSQNKARRCPKLRSQERRLRGPELDREPPDAPPSHATHRTESLRGGPRGARRAKLDERSYGAAWRWRPFRLEKSESNPGDIMFESASVTASKLVDGETVRAEYLQDTGRLRITGDHTVHAEWFPPHSWFAIASSSGHSRWGTRPDEADLLLLIDNFIGFSGEGQFALVRR